MTTASAAPAPTETPTPFIECCITTVVVEWSGDATVPDTWDFEASAPCGTIGNPTIEIETDPTGQATGTIVSSGAYGCAMTVTWQGADGWTAVGGPAQVPDKSSANAGELRMISFSLVPS